MLDRLIFWGVLLLPVLTVGWALLHGRWKKLPSARRFREMLVSGAVLMAVVAGFLAWDLSRKGAGEAARMHFQHPLYLLGLLPLYGLALLLMRYSLAGLSRGRMWLSFLLRAAILILLMLALAGLQMVIEKDVLTVLFALDRSKSVSRAEARRALDYIRSTLPSKPANDKAGLLVFGGQAASEGWPKETFVPPKLKDLKAEVRPGATDIAAALRRSISTFEEGTSKRLVLFTDGRQTQGDAVGELQRLKAMGIDVWIVPLRRGAAAEMLLEDVKVPAQLRWEQPFDARVFVYANRDSAARVRLFLGDRVIGDPEPKTVPLKAGERTAVVFRGLRLRSGGPHQIRALIEPFDKADDVLPENNEAYTFTDVATNSRVLVLTSDLREVGPLVKALEGQKLALDVRSGANLPENPEEYRRYDGIVLANLGRGFLSHQQMAVIESCVRDQGAGLVMIGGDQSFGAGGYLGTPIERALPVSMDLRNQRIMPSGALIIVLHTCEFADGNSWAKKISKAAINVLSPQDYAGLLYYGAMGGNAWLFRPTKVSRKRWMFSMINGCTPWDMPDLNRITSMAVKGLARLKRVSLKHCIIITDGDPAAPTAATVAAANKHKVSVTIITIFPHGGADISKMKRVAQQTGGRYYNPTDPRKLPLIFIKEAAIVRKSMIYSDDKGIPVSLGSPAEILREFGRGFPKVRAFVVTSLKSRAERHLYTIVEGEKVPLLARWRYGLGKAVAFTSDATNHWAPDWVAWGRYEKFWTNIFQWVCRQRMPSNHVVQIRKEGRVARVLVEALDNKGEYLNFAKLIGSASEPGVGGEDLDATTYNLKFVPTAPGRYEATFPIKKQGAYTVTVTDMSNPNKPGSIVTGMANSYSQEFRYLEPDEELLNKLGGIAGRAKGSNLKELDDLEAQPRESGLFVHNLPPARRPTDLFWQFLLAALCLLPFDIAVRRLHVEPAVVGGWIAGFFGRLLGFLRLKKKALAEAAAEAADAAGAARRAPEPLLPHGEASRAAHSRYEKAGESEAAQALDLDKPAEPVDKPKAVGGTKLSPADEAASDYTRALLKAKRRARKDRK